MIEAYKIGVNLVLDQSKILGPLGEVISAMERLQNVQKDVQGGINQMAAGYRAAARAANEMASAIDRIARAQAGVARAQAAAASTQPGGIMAGGGLGVGGGSVPRIAPIPLLLSGPGPGTFAGGPGSGGALEPYYSQGRGATEVNWNKWFPPASPRPGALDRPSLSDIMIAGAGLGVAGYGSLSFVDRLFGAGLDIGAVKAGLLTQRFTSADVAKAEAASKLTQRNVTGSSVGGNLELISMLMAMTQNSTDAIDLMPEYSKVAVAMSASGHGDQLPELQAAMRGAELRGILYTKDKSGNEVLNKPGLSQYLKNIMAINAMTHGTIGPAQITQFLQSGGVAGMLLSDDDIAASLPIMQAMKPGNAGTALSGFSQQFSSGRMSEAALHMLADMGIIKDRSKARKMGMGQFMLLPGAMNVDDQNQARAHPAEFIMDKLLPRIRAYEAKNYRKAFTGADEKTQLAMIVAAFQQIASRIPGGKEMAEVFRNNPLILRDVDAYHKMLGYTDASGKHVNGVDIFGTQVANNPKVGVSAFNAALNSLMISLAEPNMGKATGALNDLTRALNALSAAIDKHPNAARYLVDFAAGIGVVATAASAALLAIAPIAALAKISKWAAGPSSVAPSGGAGGAAATGIVGRLLGGATIGEAMLAWFVGSHVADSPSAKKFMADQDRFADDYQKRQTITLNSTHNIIVDGKKVQTTRTTSTYNVQSGTSQPDGKMSLLPAGLPSGGGN